MYKKDKFKIQMNELNHSLLVLRIENAERQTEKKTHLGRKSYERHVTNSEFKGQTSA